MAKLLIDTQLLVLLVVGTTRRSYIREHRRLKAYSEADFDLLLEVISQHDCVVFTPNTLTETSNLLGYKVQEPLRSQLFSIFREIIQRFNETYAASRDSCERQEFLRLGLADSVQLDLAQDQNTLLLTADFDLYSSGAKDGAVNFNHIREERGIV